MFLIDKYNINNVNDILYNFKLYDTVLGINHDDFFKSMPNLMFYGQDGSGKKTLIKLLLEKIYGKQVNQTEKVKYNILGYGNTNTEVLIEQSNFHLIIEPINTGLDKYLIQEIVKNYAHQQSNLLTNKCKYKIILINNVDKLHIHAQNALRRTMEIYINNCKFILCGNHRTKIIEPLLSRCLVYNVPSPSNLELFNILFNISIKEKKILSLSQYLKIINESNRNIKKAIWLLEYEYYGIIDTLEWKKILNNITKIISDVGTKKLKNDDIDMIREILYKIFITNIEPTVVMKELIDQILNKIDDDILQYKIINLGAQYESNLINGKRSVLHIEAFIHNAMYMIYIEKRNKMKKELSK